MAESTKTRIPVVIKNRRQVEPKEYCHHGWRDIRWSRGYVELETMEKRLLGRTIRRE